MPTSVTDDRQDPNWSSVDQRIMDYIHTLAFSLANGSRGGPQCSASVVVSELQAIQAIYSAHTLPIAQPAVTVGVTLRFAESQIEVGPGLDPECGAGGPITP